MSVNPSDPVAKTVVITGANRGIGLALCAVYKARNYTVYAACRQASPQLKTLDVDIIEEVDVSQDNAIAGLKKSLQGIPIDILINNAGVLQHDELGAIDYRLVQEQFEVNTLGPLKITEALCGQMKSSAKLALITSRMGSIEDNSSGGYYGYRLSKAALNSVGVSLAHDLRSRGIAVAILHPGLVGTDMIGGHGDVTPKQAAEGLAARIDQLSLENTGTFWHANGEVLPW